MNGPGGARVAPVPPAVDVGVVMALPIEAGDFRDRLKGLRKYATAGPPIVEGEHGGKLIGLVVSGAGREAARRATELLIAGHSPRLLISAGFAGGLDPELRRDDLVLPDRVVTLDGGELAIPPVVEAFKGIRRMGGRLLTVDRLAARAVEKADLRQRFAADLVDMETWAVARLAQDRLLPFVSLRVVSDTADDELPGEIAPLLSRSGSYRVGAALRAVWNRPGSLKDFWNLHARALSAADRLATGLGRLLEALPASAGGGPQVR